MGKNVVIIDYQLGNLFSVRQACEYLGYHAAVSSDPEDLKKADYVILPGVGAFADAMNNMQSLGFIESIHDYVDKGKPLMGVCLGLQLLLTESEEFGNTRGLDIIPGVVKKFKSTGPDDKVYKVPQIQWNTIQQPAGFSWQNTPLQCCRDGDFMYFVHSFYADPSDRQYVLSESEYSGLQYCSSLKKDNVFATQFHPEKSGLYGVNIYKEWFTLSH